MADNWLDVFGGENPFLDYLETTPAAAYFSHQGQFGQSPNQKQYFRSQFENVLKQYQGELGRQIQGGQVPTLRFSDYLSSWFAPQGGAAQQWGALSPRQRGAQTGGFSPTTRWMV